MIKSDQGKISLENNEKDMIDALENSGKDVIDSLENNGKAKLKNSCWSGDAFEPVGHPLIKFYQDNDDVDEDEDDDEHEHDNEDQD